MLPTSYVVHSLATPPRRPPCSPAPSPARLRMASYASLQSTVSLAAALHDADPQTSRGHTHRCNLVPSMDSSREGEDLLLGRMQLLTSVVQLGLECREALMERVDRRVLLVGQLAHSLLYGA